MAWSTPNSSRATGYLVTATNWNELAANLKYLKGQDGMIAFESGAWFNDTANARMTLGVTINQGANTDEILAFKNSGVDHGIITYAETDTFANFISQAADQGGLGITGYSMATLALQLQGAATTATTTKSTAGLGATVIVGALKSGTNLTTLGADANILAVRDYATTRFILDADGDSHQDVGTAWTNFDEHDDIALLHQLAAHVTRADDPLRERFGHWLETNRAPLQAARLVSFNDDGHHFVNMSRLSMLLAGAVRQLGDRLQLAEQRLAALPGAR